MTRRWPSTPPPEDHSGPDPDAVRAEAERILATLPRDPDYVIASRRRDLAADSRIDGASDTGQALADLQTSLRHLGSLDAVAYYTGLKVDTLRRVAAGERILRRTADTLRYAAVRVERWADQMRTA